MARRDVWTRDELVLALDLYMREGTNASASSLRELSQLLRRQSPHRDLLEDASFRSPGSVGYKLANFAALDPSLSIQGAAHGGKGDQEVWDFFAGDRERIHRTAEAIQRNAPILGSPDESAEDWDEDEFEAPEGRVLTRTHRSRERNKKVIDRKKNSVLGRTGRLECETCGFDFASRYGAHGKGFIECHHLTPVSMLDPEAKTKLSDLALLCSNCHRMIHRSRPWLSLDELRSLIAAG